MPRPITKEPPKGSRLEKIVNWMRAEAGTAKPFWKYTADDVRTLDFGNRPDLDPDRAAEAIRSIGVDALLRNEPRLWALPREIVRDYLILPDIANTDGPAIAEALRGTSVLEDFVDLVRENAKRSAPAHKRLAQTESIEAYVTLTVMAELYDGWDSSESANARYERVQRRLGIDRNAVRRMDRRFRRRMGGLPDVERSMALSAVYAVQKMLVHFYAGMPCSTAGKQI